MRKQPKAPKPPKPPAKKTWQCACLAIVEEGKRCEACEATTPRP